MFLIGILAFICEYLDSGLGMGYGTALAPIMIMMGYQPLQVVPAILISQLVTDIAACFSHHRCSNVNLKIDSKDFKIAFFLGLISSVGVIISTFVALKIPKRMLTLYIGILVFSMGIIILATRKRAIRLSWNKIAGISLLASFNKGISGGGYGPLVMGGQLLSGVNAKNSVGITAFAEAITCLVGFAMYFIFGRAIDWKLVGILIVFAVPAVPLAALTVKKINAQQLKKYIGILITFLGLMTIFKMTSG